MVVRLLITDRWLDPLATAHDAAESGTGLRAPADGPLLGAAEALLWCDAAVPTCALISGRRVPFDAAAGVLVQTVERHLRDLRTRLSRTCADSEFRRSSTLTRELPPTGEC